MQTTILPPKPELLLAPLLASLPAAAVSPQPPTALLPQLSPILRQRVQLLSSASSDPWLPLLCYDNTKSSSLENIAKNERLEPHPVSGEVEVDWESEVSIRYRRIDEETLLALVSITGLGLSVRLIWCVNDELGGGDGWRIGEVTVPDPSDSSWGSITIGAAETNFKNSPTHHLTPTATNGNSLHTPDEEEDDDGYWAQYDKTPGTTPAPPKHSPAPAATGGGTDEDEYYAQYASVQPAMDNHDPDEAAQNGEVESSLGQEEVTRELQNNISHTESRGRPQVGVADVGGLIQPRPSSSGSSGSETVDRLEKRAEMEASREASEVGIKQHISTSVKSLYRLARVSGIEREEFERLIRTELEVLGLMEEDE